MAKKKSTGDKSGERDDQATGPYYCIRLHHVRSPSFAVLYQIWIINSGTPCMTKKVFPICSKVKLCLQNTLILLGYHDGKVMTHIWTLKKLRFDFRQPNTFLYLHISQKKITLVKSLNVIFFFTRNSNISSCLNIESVVSSVVKLYLFDNLSYVVFPL